MSVEIDELYCLSTRCQCSLSDFFRRTDECQHRAIVIPVRLNIQYSHFTHFSFFDNCVDNLFPTALAKVWNTLDELQPYHESLSPTWTNFSFG